MHHTAIVNFGITSEKFYSMTIAEFKLLSEQHKFKQQQRKLDLLDQALYISCLVLNKEAKKTYEDIYNSITDEKPQVEESGDILMNCINRALELGLKVPQL